MRFTTSKESGNPDTHFICISIYTLFIIVEEISEEFAGKITVAKVDVDGSPSTAAKFGIRNIPTILFFKDGKVADKQVGAVPKNSLVEKINKLL